MRAPAPTASSSLLLSISLATSLSMLAAPAHAHASSDEPNEGAADAPVATDAPSTDAASTDAPSTQPASTDAAATTEGGATDEAAAEEGEEDEGEPGMLELGELGALPWPVALCGAGGAMLIVAVTSFVVGKDIEATTLSRPHSTAQVEALQTQRTVAAAIAYPSLALGAAGVAAGITWAAVDGARVLWERLPPAPPTTEDAPHSEDAPQPAAEAAPDAAPATSEGT